MRMRILAVFVLTLALVSVSFAQGVNGTWKGQRPGRDGAMMDVTFKFVADGEKLSGSTTMGTNEVQISDGKVSGNDISFVVKMERGGNTMVMKYTGTLSTNEIKLKSTREGSDRVTEVTLKRS
ncbi:MAG: hypothetical protein Q8N47_17645 [Bryobacterales bacterium]|nr:hypothetical protein [Bryobacterales bacterium]